MLKEPWQPTKDEAEGLRRIASVVTALEARYLALGLVNIVTVLSPQRLIVGGGVMRHPALLARVRERVQAILAGYVRAPAVMDAIDRFIVPPALGERAGVLGALALAAGEL